MRRDFLLAGKSMCYRSYKQGQYTLATDVASQSAVKLAYARCLSEAGTETNTVGGSAAYVTIRIFKFVPDDPRRGTLNLRFFRRSGLGKKY